MNRALLFGIAIFFAIVGLSLVGGQAEVVAGHRCNGSSCDGGRGHHGRDRCSGRGHHGRDRCHGRGHRDRDRCHGRGHHGRHRCNGGNGCNGGGHSDKVAAPVQKGDDVPAAPAQKGSVQAPQQK